MEGNLVLLNIKSYRFYTKDRQTSYSIIAKLNKA